jgi:hypothetical protein
MIQALAEISAIAEWDGGVGHPSGLNFFTREIDDSAEVILSS